MIRRARFTLTLFDVVVVLSAMAFAAWALIEVRNAPATTPQRANTEVVPQ